MQKSGKRERCGPADRRTGGRCSAEERVTGGPLCSPPSPLDLPKHLPKSRKAHRGTVQVINPDSGPGDRAENRERHRDAMIAGGADHAAGWLVSAGDEDVSPEISALPPSARMLDAMRSSRSLSLTRNSATSRNTVVPRALVASAASSGISSINPGISSAETSVPTSGDGPATRAPTGSSNCGPMSSAATRPPILSNTWRNPVRSG